MAKTSKLTIRDAVRNMTVEAGHPFKKDVVKHTGVSNDRLTRTLDVNNGGTVADLVKVLNSYGYDLAAARDGGVVLLTVEGK